jgi:ECF sigma factor
MTNGVRSGPVDGRGEVTRLLQEMREGDPKAAEEFLARVYCELHSIAGRLMAREAPGHILFFVGLPQEQAAEDLGVSVSTVERKCGLMRGPGFFVRFRKGERRRSLPGLPGILPYESKSTPGWRHF